MVSGCWEDSGPRVYQRLHSWTLLHACLFPPCVGTCSCLISFNWFQCNICLSNMFSTNRLVFEECVKWNTAKAHMLEDLEHFCGRTSSQKNSHTKEEISSRYLWIWHWRLTMPGIHLFRAFGVGTAGGNDSLCSNLLGLQLWIFCLADMTELKQKQQLAEKHNVFRFCPQICTSNW